MPCHCLLSILFLVTDCSVLYSLSLYAQYYIPCPWVLSIIFIVPVCLVFYSLSLTAPYYYYIPCHCLLRIIFIVTDCSLLYSLSLTAQCSVLCSLSLLLSIIFLVTDCPTLKPIYIPCHRLSLFFYSLLCCELNLYSLTLIDMRLFLDTTALYYWTKLFRPGAELLLRTWLSKFFKSSARLIVNVIVHNSFLCKGRKETTKWI